jgi:hypothetical protein
MEIPDFKFVKRFSYLWELGAISQASNSCNKGFTYWVSCGYEQINLSVSAIDFFMGLT